MKIKKTVYPTDKPINNDEFHAKKLVNKNIVRKDSNYVFSMGGNQSKNEYIPLNK
jgi:hypothetical protein